MPHPSSNPPSQSVEEEGTVVTSRPSPAPPRPAFRPGRDSTLPGTLPLISFDWRTVDPERIRAGGILVEERLAYRENIESLLDHKGRYVLIRGSEIVSLFDDLGTAARAAQERFGRGPFLVKKIVALEPLHYLGGAASTTAGAES